MEGNVVTVERVIPAPPSAIFDLIADPSRHPDFDGSGSVKNLKSVRSEQLGLGSTFSMSMQLGVKYTMENTVIEFEKDRRITWQVRPPGFVGKFAGGRIWRYELEPVGEGTRVRESWDISQDHQRFFFTLGKFSTTTKANMEKSLARLEELTAGSG
jgi:uncharacterized protein YndB with AHSA1/START domain